MSIRRWPGLAAMDIAPASDTVCKKSAVSLRCIIAAESGLTIFAKLKTVPDV
ncbi:hypothetical protein ACTJK3_23435 [Pseudomonas sp. 22105]|uniref:hypothetical protein n=1 Tax=Pseudomonas TaxID=286 RepID=UPI0014839C2B|nr:MULTISPECIES: hypothetical protein [Pseudomonas]NKF28779.1 hypothetical protein [Pseudomonas sp. BG5]